MDRKNNFTRLLGIDYPIIQGPLGGGISTKELVATVSNAGGLGSFGAHMLGPSEIKQLVTEIRDLTSRPFALNLWVSDRDPEAVSITNEEFLRHRDFYSTTYQTLNATPPEQLRGKPEFTFEQQAEALIKTKPAAFSFVFGIPSPEILRECDQQGIVTIGTATTIEEARAIEAAGCKMIVATGFEAGGHRPSFLAKAEDSLMGTLSLVPLITDRVKIPVIAAGGIGDSRGIAAAFCLGASAVQIGTAFLACDESGAGHTHREYLLGADEERTVLSRAFTGRLARYLPNKFINSFEERADPALPFPIQSELTGPIRAAALEQDNRDLIAPYSGQAAPMLKHRSAAKLMEALIKELP